MTTILQADVKQSSDWGLYNNTLALSLQPHVRSGTLTIGTALYHGEWCPTVYYSSPTL